MPIIEILIRQLKGQGFERITLSVGHLAGLIRAFCGDGSQWGIPIDYVYEDEPLGTIGCLGLLDDLDGADRLLVVNGDTLTDMSMPQPSPLTTTAMRSRFAPTAARSALISECWRPTAEAISRAIPRSRPSTTGSAWV